MNLKNLGLLVLALAGCLLAGCADLPDVQPFSDATLRLRSAVASSGAAVVSELQRVDIPGVEAQATKLETSWAERNRVFSSLVDYASSLQGIVDAGKSGAEAAGALADSVKRLAEAANLVEPGSSEVAAVATDTAKFIYEQIARARAAKSLERALADIQPAVQRIAEVVASDMKDLDVLLRVASQAQRNTLQERFQREIAYRDQLRTSRETLYATLQRNLSEGAAPSKLAEANELQKVDELLAAAENACEPFDGAVAEIETRERLGRQLITEINSALVDWATVHGRMLGAVRTRRPPSTAELTLAAQRIQSLVERYQQL